MGALVRDLPYNLPPNLPPHLPYKTHTIIFHANSAANTSTPNSTTPFTHNQHCRSPVHDQRSRPQRLDQAPPAKCAANIPPTPPASISPSDSAYLRYHQAKSRTKSNHRSHSPHAFQLPIAGRNPDRREKVDKFHHLVRFGAERHDIEVLPPWTSLQYSNCEIAGSRRGTCLCLCCYAEVED